MSKKGISTLILVCSMLMGIAQQDSVFAFVKSIPGSFTDFTVDNLGNIFLANNNGQLKKLGPTGDSIAVFNNLTSYGKTFSIDVSNPMKVLLFYRDFGTVVVLDRFLNIRNVIDLRKQQLFQVKAIGQSYDNNIWVYDELESKLKKVGEDGRILDQSTDFRLMFDSLPSFSFIVDQNKLVYLYDPKHGVFMFDYYGAFKSRIRFTGWSDFTVVNNILFGRDDNMLYRYEPGTLNLQQYPITNTFRLARKIKITQLGLYLLYNDRLDVYKW